ncbi:MAG: tetratricopeptide repeat protein [Actinobacteria bacterium]|nr:tetratricopeptide repeat protein [Actinomycetota bacterium]
MTKSRSSFMARRKLQQKIVFGFLAVILTLGLLGSSITWTLNRSNVPQASQEAPATPTAEELAEKSKANPQDVSLLKELAAAYSSEGQSGKAVETYEKALSLAPESEDLKTGLAGSCVSAGQYDKAEKILQELISSNPNNKEAHYYYGHTLVARKDYAGAVGEFEKYVSLAGENDPHTARVKSLIETLKPLAKQ